MSEITKSPHHLSHKPIISANNYNKIDAQHSNQSDVVSLSIGKAQYNQDEISLKVWRYTGEKWSRQSEELPLHRNIDLNILLLGALLTKVDSNYPVTNLSEEIENKDGVSDIKDFYKKHEHFLRPRLEELKDKLDEFLKSK